MLYYNIGHPVTFLWFIRLVEKKNTYTIQLFLLFTLLLHASCDKFEGDQTVPSSISIDSFTIDDNPSLDEGSLSHKITDAWVYVDDQLIGCFGLPAEIPVLVSGSHKLMIAAGIKYNGMSGIHGQYPIYKPFIQEQFTFFVDSMVSVMPTVSYYSNAVFVWMEDFEDGFISLETTDSAYASLDLVYHDPHDPLNGFISAEGKLYGDASVLECATNVSNISGFDLPAQGTPVFLEMNYQNDTPFAVGMFARWLGQVTRHPVVVLNPTKGKWNKIYINFTPLITDNASALDFNLYIYMEKDPALDTSVVRLDNMKLIYR